MAGMCLLAATKHPNALERAFGCFRGIQSLAQRTQQLINAFASSAAGKLSGAATGLQSNGRNVPSGGNETSYALELR